MLYSQGREYFVLRPEPIPGDSWEGDNAYRWLVVPNKEIGRKKMKESEGIHTYEYWVSVYSFARHIVTTAFVVDYASGMPEIYVETPDEVGADKTEIDVSKTEWKEETQLNILADWYPEQLVMDQGSWNNLFRYEESA
jgi:hypothetical protein